jgi:hypothetical protein
MMPEPATRSNPKDSDVLRFHTSLSQPTASPEPPTGGLGAQDGLEGDFAAYTTID